MLRNRILQAFMGVAMVVLAVGVFGGATSTTALSATVVYDATPNPVPPNVVSLGFEATSTSEFGDYVHLAGTDRVLNTVTVTMSDWALYSDYSADTRYSSDAVNWTHPSQSTSIATTWA